MISHEEVLRRLEYFPLSGEFYWRKTSNKRESIRAGKLAGCYNIIHKYFYISLNNTLYATHRLAWFYVYKEWPNTIDHIDNNKSNNKIVNLRNVSQKENTRNRLDSPSFGHNIRIKRDKYQVYYNINYVQKTFGAYTLLSTAVLVRDYIEGFIDEKVQPPSILEIEGLLKETQCQE
jgi:hypothetical protein